MARATSFDQISSDPQVAALLKSLYQMPDNVEFYPGLFAEDRVPKTTLPGLLLAMVAVDAFSQALTNPCYRNMSSTTKPSSLGASRSSRTRAISATSSSARARLTIPCPSP
jgi:hypothetical protein